MAGRRLAGEIYLFDWGALLAALAIGTFCLFYGFQVANNPASAKDGVPASMDFFLGSIILLAAACDIRMLVRGGIAGPQRIARHLWRMCFALFIASGSFFMGRQRIFPLWVRESNILILLTILPLLLLIFWLIRILFTRAFQKLALTRGGDGYSTSV